MISHRSFRALRGAALANRQKPALFGRTNLAPARTLRFYAGDVAARGCQSRCGKRAGFDVLSLVQRRLRGAKGCLGCQNLRATGGCHQRIEPASRHSGHPSLHGGAKDIVGTDQLSLSDVAHGPRGIDRALGGTALQIANGGDQAKAAGM
ncbi:hypothetical protein NX02_19940 [Sphingomonas sanxanigenens DSM 19645 = NX02]|uniref:Uncharacterized protein n=1 Tax=Sphingomonas sanxanigenens DSM 19645 = NX02 TaxID=1123269 RepID=W0AGH9_9SPHN|nr:hypothetical protein NX02_19940 [Sphingomonas sanxanigenens DSM 19645 = NX02]